jgi:hypothetical protein
MKLGRCFKAKLALRCRHSRAKLPRSGQPKTGAHQSGNKPVVSVFGEINVLCDTANPNLHKD